MAEPSVSGVPPASRRYKSALQRLEGSLLAHPSARFEEAPARLAHHVTGGQINRRDKVAIWRESAGPGHRIIARPGVVTIDDVGLIGHTRRNGMEHGSLQAIVNIADRAGRPLMFPFKKHWSVRSSLKHVDLLFARTRSRPSGKVALLGSSQVSFYHFVTEVAGDWWFLKQMGYSERDFSAIVVHGERTAWQDEVLDLLRIPATKRRYHFEMRERRVDLVLPYRTKGEAVSVPSWMCAALRGELGRETVYRAGARKLFLSRKGAPRRRMTNEADLTAPLDSLGFEVVQLETMTVAEQQALLGSARVVVAEHGAALTNLIWCPAGAAVIEILPTTLPNPCFKILAEQRGLRYLPVFAPRRTRHRQDDWRIDADAIEAVLAAVRSL